MKRTTHLTVATAACGIGLLALATPAAAHVTPEPGEVPAGVFTAVTLTVPHGCEGSPTAAIDIQVPESILDVTPAVVAGWDVMVETEVLDEPIEGAHGEQITERESVVTYTAQPGNELPDGFRQSFTIGFQAPDTPGEHLFFKTIQRCVEGETAWIAEYTGEGEEPEAPAPVVLVTESDSDSHAQGASDEGDDADGTDTDDIEDSDDEAAASDDGGGSGEDSTGLAVVGLAVGALGLAAGSTALLRSRQGG